jgi:hypothetical protein
MEPAPGEMENAAFEGLAVTGPLEQPATASKAGAMRMVKKRSGNRTPPVGLWAANKVARRWIVSNSIYRL